PPLRVRGPRPAVDPRGAVSPDGGCRIRSPPGAGAHRGVPPPAAACRGGRRLGDTSLLPLGPPPARADDPPCAVVSGSLGRAAAAGRGSRGGTAGSGVRVRHALVLQRALSGERCSVGGRPCLRARHPAAPRRRAAGLPAAGGLDGPRRSGDSGPGERAGRRSAGRRLLDAAPLIAVDRPPQKAKRSTAPSVIVSVLAWSI